MKKIPTSRVTMWHSATFRLGLLSVKLTTWGGML